MENCCPWPWGLHFCFYQYKAGKRLKSESLVRQCIFQFPLHTVPDLRWFKLWFFNFTMLQKWYTSSRNCNFKFWILIFSRLALSSCDAGHGQQASAPISPSISRVNNRCTYNHSVSRQPFCFSLSVQYSINYMSYLTLHYQIGFMLDDFAQL